ncbi:MAG: DUF2357 domain-containing protein [bacterium]
MFYPRVLRWPWDGVGHGRADNATASLDYSGTALLLCDENARVLPMVGSSDLARHTQGPGFRLYELPQGNQDPSEPGIEIQAHLEGRLSRFRVDYKGARCRRTPGNAGVLQESPESITVFDWWDAFDDLRQLRLPSDGAILWRDVEAWLGELRETSEPRKALIVEIAEHLGPSLDHRVTHMRRILRRERDMVPVHAIKQMDEACLRWYVRQPGETMSEKAGHRQELMSVVRRESFDTLENRVLKDFLQRCMRASRRYLRRFREEFPDSKRVVLVSRFERRCQDALQVPEFEHVSTPRPGAQPNYVLQSHPQYRDIWRWYQRLLRNQDSEEQVWNWQGRLWGDVCRFLVGTACQILCEGSGRAASGPVPLFPAPFFLEETSVLGRRLKPGWAPGPLLARRFGSNPRVVTVVDGNELHLHPNIHELARLGAHFALVAEPIRVAGPRRILLVWCINSMASAAAIDAEEIAESSIAALESALATIRRSALLSEARLDGLVLLSGMDPGSEMLASLGSGESAQNPGCAVARLGARPADWSESALEVAALLENWL